MSESEWSALRHPWERLTWARTRWQTERGGATTAAAAAESLGIKENTYSAYEREPGELLDKKKKHTPLTHQRAIQFGDKFKVNWVWLLTGEEHPFARSGAQQRAVKLLADAPVTEQERAVDLLEVALRQRKVG